MAIGKFHDENTGDVWGIVAQAIVGTLLAGSNLVIESAKKDGGVAVFRVDADGARLYNSRFDLVNEYSAGNSGQISLIPHIGFVGGLTTTTSPLLAYDEDGNVDGVLTASGDTITSAAKIDFDNLPNANWLMDMEGNVYFKGTVYATDGVFNGTVYAQDGEFTGTVNARDLQLDGTSISNVFQASQDENGELDYLQIGSITIDGKTGAITFAGGSTDIVQVEYALSSSGPWQSEWNDSWTDVEVWAHYSYDGGASWGPATRIQSVNGQDGEDGSDARVPSYIKSTYISQTKVVSPTITGDYVNATQAFRICDVDSDLDPTETYGFMGYATGKKIVVADGTLSTATSYGVALAGPDVTTTNGCIDFESEGAYVIVTDSGARVQCGSHNVTVTSSGVFIDGEKFSGASVAVFG